MLRGDRSFECKWTRRAVACFVDKRQRLVDLRPVPTGAILFFKNDEIALIIKTCFAS